MTTNSTNKAWLRALALTAPIGRDSLTTLPSTVTELARTHSESLALVSENATLSYAALVQRMEQYATWAISQGLCKGDVIGLVLPNSPDYVAIWLGLSRIGCIVGLVNTNLRSVALEQAISLILPKHVIISGTLSDAYASVQGQVDPAIKFWAHGSDIDQLPRIEDTCRIGDQFPNELFAARTPSVHDVALYLYTSGTTGLSKAVPISHFRLMQWSFWFAGMIDVKPNDRMYNCLPMYHSVGGIVANGAMLVSGGSVVIRERFSARRFWADIVQFECTLFQYIGEMCRYLVNSPTNPPPEGHQIRLACGNGLRRSVWEILQLRFKIPAILEFYAATEGNISLYNIEGLPGSIGRIPGFLADRFPLALVKYDHDLERPLRGEDGFCVRCANDEPGEAIGRIPTGGNKLLGRFEGYLDPVATQHKILRNVFAPGDAWFRSGDLMRRDSAGFYYFVDRIGDTFRWKGENVSSDEVAETLASYPGVEGAVVYGVEIPGHEGRAGMATLVINGQFDLCALSTYLSARLPDYACPVFLRLSQTIEVTGTFKNQKQKLASEAYDISMIIDPMYIRARNYTGFKTLDSDVHAAIQNGEIVF